MRNYVLLVIMGLFAIAPGCQAKSLTKEQAEQAAVVKFRQFCANFKLNSKDFVGPIDDAKGRNHYSFRWEDRSADNRLTILVMVQLDGETNVSTLNHSNGPKYRHIAP
jgi:hypothetical protein